MLLDSKPCWGMWTGQEASLQRVPLLSLGALSMLKLPLLCSTAWQLCLCLPDLKPDMQTDTLAFTANLAYLHRLQGPHQAVADLLIDSRFDPHPQLLVHVPDCPWVRVQPCLLAMPLDNQPACLSQGACPHCSLKHRLSVDQNSSSGELLRTMTQTM